MDYMKKLPGGKYRQLENEGVIVMATGTPHVLANTCGGQVVIKLDYRSSEILESQLMLYRDAQSSGVSVCLNGVGDTIRQMLAESSKRESLLQRIIADTGFLDGRLGV